MYQFWLGDILLPITPEKVTIACGTKNTLFDCVNGNEVVFPKTGKLKTIKFQAILPNTEYPFSRYVYGFKNADYFKTAIEKLKSDLKPFHFVITREVNITKVLNYTDIEAVIEDYSFTESADNGYDIVMDITLKHIGLFTLDIRAMSLVVPSSIPIAPSILGITAFIPGISTIILCLLSHINALASKILPEAIAS